MEIRTSDSIGSALVDRGFAFVAAETMRERLVDVGASDRAAFAASWNALGLDTWMADGGRYRRRGFAVFTADSRRIVREAHQPHFQSRAYNLLNGGVERWFDPIADDIAAGPTMRAIVAWVHRGVDDLRPRRRWRVEVHQFRIEARADTPGKPTPEGEHRDGVDYVFILMIDRVNVIGGATTIYSADGRPLARRTLAPLEAVWLDDARVSHGVDEISPADPSFSAHRDTLVVTFRSAGRPQIHA